MTNFEQFHQPDQPKTEKWKELVPFIRKCVQSWELDDDPAHLVELLAKASTREIVNGKGFCLNGKTGCGKSLRAELFAKLNDVTMLSAEEIGLRFVAMSGNDIAFREYLKADGVRYSEVSDFFHDLVIDDLGIEEEKYCSYGNICDVMRDYVIPFRYKVFPKYKTYFTTNLNKEQLADRYGQRCFSRLNEMCVFVSMTHGDRRLGE